MGDNPQLDGSSVLAMTLSNLINNVSSMAELSSLKNRDLKLGDEITALRYLADGIQAQLALRLRQLNAQSAIYTLPDEILSDIFLFCWKCEGNPVMVRARLELVCFRWRTVTRNTPFINSTIHNFASRRRNLRILSESGGGPLDIVWAKGGRPVLELVGGCVERWRSFTSDETPKLAPADRAVLSKPAPLLERFNVTLGWLSQPDTLGGLQDFRLFNFEVPKLQHVKIPLHLLHHRGTPRLVSSDCRTLSLGFENLLPRYKAGRNRKYIALALCKSNKLQDLEIVGFGRVMLVTATSNTLDLAHPEVMSGGISAPGDDIFGMYESDDSIESVGDEKQSLILNLPDLRQCRLRNMDIIVTRWVLACSAPSIESFAIHLPLGIDRKPLLKQFDDLPESGLFATACKGLTIARISIAHTTPTDLMMTVSDGIRAPAVTITWAIRPERSLVGLYMLPRSCRASIRTLELRWGLGPSRGLPSGRVEDLVLWDFTSLESLSVTAADLNRNTVLQVLGGMLIPPDQPAHNQPTKPTSWACPQLKRLAVNGCGFDLEALLACIRSRYGRDLRTGLPSSSHPDLPVPLDVLDIRNNIFRPINPDSSKVISEIESILGGGQFVTQDEADVPR